MARAACRNDATTRNLELRDRSGPGGTAPPQALPLLSRGKHRDPSHGACFMEYTSVLAGERFTDAPQCVDAELAAVLRGANDMLTDEERPAMVPLLGRAIGLVVPVPELLAGRAGFWLPRRRPDCAEQSLARTAALRSSVTERFRRAVGLAPSHPRWAWYTRHVRVSRLFWELMNEPAPPETSAPYLERLVVHLDLLHSCYEEGLEDLGVPRRAMPATPTAKVGNEKVSNEFAAARAAADAG